MTEARIPVAVIGSGNIRVDLCERLSRDPDFEPVALIGRRPDSPGLQRASRLVGKTLSGGYSDLKVILDDVAGVFDATSAFDHAHHWGLIEERGRWAVDLTPSDIGRPMVPVLAQMESVFSIDVDVKSTNYSMVTCGGQSSAPMLFAIARNCTHVREVEVSSSIAARSAGPATRRNIDHYIASTEALARLIAGPVSAKSILVLNPAEPPIAMRTTVTVRADRIDRAAVARDCAAMVERVQKTVPGYSVVVSPHSPDPDRIEVTAQVIGAGYYLPTYAGNLDIINAAAVETARLHSKAHASSLGATR